MSGVYIARTETSQEEQRRIRITSGSLLIHSFPMPLGTEIGHLDRTVTTDVTFSIHLLLILLLLSRALARILHPSFRTSDITHELRVAQP